MSQQAQGLRDRAWLKGHSSCPLSPGEIGVHCSWAQALPDLHSLSNCSIQHTEILLLSTMNTLNSLRVTAENNPSKSVLNNVFKLNSDKYETIVFIEKSEIRQFRSPCVLIGFNPPPHHLLLQLHPDPSLRSFSWHGLDVHHRTGSAGRSQCASDCPDALRTMGCSPPAYEHCIHIVKCIIKKWS